MPHRKGRTSLLPVFVVQVPIDAAVIGQSLCPKGGLTDHHLETIPALSFVPQRRQLLLTDARDSRWHTVQDLRIYTALSRMAMLHASPSRT